MTDSSNQLKKSCQNCIHLQKLNLSKIVWDGTFLPSYGCGIKGIENHWPDPQAVIEATHLDPETKAEMIALQCPRFKFVGSL